MKLKGSATLAVLLSGALFLGACSSGETPKGTEEPSKKEEAVSVIAEGAESCLKPLGITAPADGEIKYTAGAVDWSGYNSMKAATYSTYNSVIANMMFAGFQYYGTDGTICRDENFGTFEIKSESPMVVEYKISEDAKWSDGTPITINDYLLDWAAQNPEFLAPGYASGENADATPVFEHVSNSLANKAPKGPQGEVGSKTFTIEYTNPDPDWQINVSSALPAHVVAKQAGLTPEQLAKAILDQDAATVKKAAEFWNNGWTFKPGELPDMALMPSSGPYKVKEGGWKAGNSLTLTQNEAYWGEPPATKDMIFRFIADDGQTQALQNGDVQVIEPQATVDTVKQLEALAPAVNTLTFPTLTWEHMDFNFRENTVFGNAKSGKAAREAFAMCTPRQAIVDSLIKPVQEDAVILNAREVFPFQEKYDEVTKVSYDGRYDQVDIEGAKAKLAEAGLTGKVDVRLAYNAPNPRRTETVALIKSSCDQAGFNVIDSGSDDFFSTKLGAGDFDIALYAWAGSGQKTSGENIYSTNGGQNAQKYSNKKVDEAFSTLSAALDDKVWTEQIKVIETELWNDLFGIPLYTHPGVVGYDAKLQNVRPTTTQSMVSWNAYQWVAAS